MSNNKDEVKVLEEEAMRSLATLGLEKEIPSSPAQLENKQFKERTRSQK